MQKNICVNREENTKFHNHATVCVGSGRMDLALQEQYQQHLALVQEEIGFSYIRGHGLFCDQMGIYREKEQNGQKVPFYNFTYLDRIFDGYLKKGIRPFVELGFMPSALASGQQTIFYWKGNVTLPADVKKWQQLVQKTLEHWISRYGAAEVESWLFEVWNEPNIDFLAGDLAEYCDFYRDTAAAVKEVDPKLQVGGPSICGIDVDRWLNGFFSYCQQNRVPLDFVTRHCYCGGETHENGEYVHHHMNEPENMTGELKETRKIMAAYEITREIPLHITEFNTSYTPHSLVHDTVYNAAYIADLLSRAGEDADSYSYWTFSDVFEEQDVPRAQFHGGFGLVAMGGIRKPTFYTYRFYAHAGDRLLYRDEHLLITAEENRQRYHVIAWNMTSQGLSGVQEEEKKYRIRMPAFDGGAGAMQLLTRIDEQHGNAAKGWCDMGCPRTPDEKQMEILQRLSAPETVSTRLKAEKGFYETEICLQQNMVEELELTPCSAPSQPYDGFEPEYGFGLQIGE